MTTVAWIAVAVFVVAYVLIAGVIGELSNAATRATEGRLWVATLLMLWASAGLSAIIDNIPYVATMSPIVADLVHANGTPRGDVLWWALALGADLGGNATAVGASANVVILGIAERAGQRISFWEFTKYGLIRGEAERQGAAVAAVVDHAVAARKAGLALPDTQVIIFGNPRPGTPLMLAAPGIALDLPLRIMIRDDGQPGSLVTGQDPMYVAHRFGLTDDQATPLKAPAAIAAAALDGHEGRSDG